MPITHEIVSDVTTLAVKQCPVCGVWYALPEIMDKHNRAKGPGNDWWCPNGHVLHYPGKTEVDRQRERAERLERQLANRDEDLRAARASVTAMKGQVTKMKKREANGVCPCCHRSFVNVARHMTTKHPDYADAT